MGTLDNIRQLYEQKRKQLDLNQVKLAKLLNISQSAISQYLNGQIPLNTDFIVDFARIFKVSPITLDPSLQTTFLLGKTKRPVPMLNEQEALSLFASEGALGFRIPNNDYSPRFALGDIVVFQPLDISQLAQEILIILYHGHEYFIGRMVGPKTFYTQKAGKSFELTLPHKQFQCGLIESIIPDSLSGEF